jgi:hypothetical protein
MEVSWGVLVILLPGIIALKLHDAITGIGRREYKEMILTSVLYVLFVYGVAFSISLIPGAPVTLVLDGDAFNGWTIPIVLASAFVVGWVAAIADEHRWAFHMAKWLGRSNRGWRGAWLDAFLLHGRKKWACVYLKDGTRVLGWVKYGSSPTEEQALYVARGERGDEPVLVWRPSDAEPYPIEGPGVLIPPSSEISLVAFLRGEESPVRRSAA